MIKDIKELRTFMLEGLEKLRAKEITPAQLNAESNSVGKLIGFAKVELEYRKLEGSTPKMDFLDGIAENVTVAIDKKIKSLEKKDSDKE